eukprot:TRINITY_DN2825_c0_g1_i2.p1 TRINITY_DN2825_c0_g1~~TRINITY_DN2825_c0_g1_i2.p1  ORF type:complete len:295 (+),score=89.53 TRINITY_DN2825_c0_g1_i2:208-1092(+)
MALHRACGASPATAKKIHGRYEKLLLPELHRLTERWYYVESKPRQQRMFKNVMKALWDVVTGRAPRCAEVSEKHIMIAATYARGILREQFHAAAEVFVARHMDAPLLEEFRQTFGSLHVVKKRRPTTQYTADYPLHGFHDFIRARPVTCTKESRDHQFEKTWANFRTRHPKPPAAHESRVSVPKHISAQTPSVKTDGSKGLKHGTYTPVPTPPGYERFRDHRAATPPPGVPMSEMDKVGRALFAMTRPRTARPPSGSGAATVGSGVRAQPPHSARAGGAAFRAERLSGTAVGLK